MKYKFNQKELNFSNGRKSFVLSVTILDENSNKDKELSDNVTILIDSEYLSYDYLERAVKQVDGITKESDGSTLHDVGEGVYWQVYPNETVIWSWIDEQDGVPFEKTWINNEVLLTIGKHFYEVKKTYVKDEGYLGVTDEIFEV
ncbi:hypothetical protein HB943_14900 [Listeria weihenstephanensis]|uniref:Uncharacterized protein n=1 Tax=Listeria weihenstephanensis TaxID=1006155 RepID=A0A841ZBM7_9LIST|nr:hypothetical protein [Listeria weihenstephanensis]MBC1501887.1 hypothetical protein [Listeria weihenstephanensis]